MFKYRILFDIHYKANFGEFLVLVGNIQELGNWDVSKGLKLSWMQGDVWKTKTTINHNCAENCEYKYVLCREHKLTRKLEVLRWEEGPNRAITFKNIKKLMFNIKDIWGLRKLCLRIPNNLEKSSQVLKISGNIPQLGNFLKSYEMKLVYKKQKNSDAKEQYWEMEILIDPLEKEITYCYFSYDKENTGTSYERKKYRTVEFSFTASDSSQNENDFSLNLHTNNYSSNAAILKNNCYKIYDFDFQNRFLCNEINENILLGPCPQNKEEVEILRKNGVKAILNLQRDKDMERMNINWASMKEIYGAKDMEVVNYQIKDNTPDKIGERILNAAKILNEMIEKYQKVYVHCTAGKIRSPYTVMVYLCLYKRVPLDKAIETMKIKRPMALAKKTMLIKVIQYSKQVNHYCLYV